MKNLSASDRSALIKLASALPKGDPERRIILGGLRKVGGHSEASLLKAIGTEKKTPWTATEVWAKVQTKLSESQVQDIVKEQLESDDWPDDEDAAMDAAEKAGKAIPPIQVVLEKAWKAGKLVRIKTRGGGGEWAIPGTPAAKNGKTSADW